ncbi:hypothetical protein HMPREF9371_2143 [Neisseria shayeganii 871]|uniref:Uncharacterized protein n=1 Tax=Neisseria shayeganii 871 TaxID=1032488 RepID=G4CKK3_9NEIS|nr:hypothetical protein HMPREF9371_2143 [Neisseria shayeganii 871]
MISLIYLPIMVSLCVPLHDSAYVMMIVMRIKRSLHILMLDFLKNG